jgi:hypothetical protein
VKIELTTDDVISIVVIVLIVCVTLTCISGAGTKKSSNYELCVRQCSCSSLVGTCPSQTECLKNCKELAKP